MADRNVYELLKCGLTINTDCDNPLFVRQCGYDFEKSIRCVVDAQGEPTGESILLIVEIDEQTKVPTPTYYTLPDLAVWSGDPDTLAQCDDKEIESDPEVFCDEGTGFLRWYVKENGVPTQDYYDTLYDGTLYTASGNEVPGMCDIEEKERVGTWLPLCVDGSQWYSRDIVVNGLTINEYKQGVDGLISTTPPVGSIITGGHCSLNNTPGVDSIPPSTTVTFNPFIYGTITVLLIGGDADITADGNTVTFPEGWSGTRSADADLDDTITVTTDANCTALINYVR